MSIFNKPNEKKLDEIFDEHFKDIDNTIDEKTVDNSYKKLMDDYHNASRSKATDSIRQKNEIKQFNLNLFNFFREIRAYITLKPVYSGLALGLSVILIAFIFILNNKDTDKIADFRQTKQIQSDTNSTFQKPSQDLAINDKQPPPKTILLASISYDYDNDRSIENSEPKPENNLVDIMQKDVLSVLDANGISYTIKRSDSIVSEDLLLSNGKFDSIRVKLIFNLNKSKKSIIISQKEYSSDKNEKLKKVNNIKEIIKMLKIKRFE